MHDVCPSLPKPGTLSTPFATFNVCAAGQTPTGACRLRNPLRSLVRPGSCAVGFVPERLPSAVEDEVVDWLRLGILRIVDDRRGIDSRRCRARHESGLAGRQVRNRDVAACPSAALSPRTHGGDMIRPDCAGRYE